MGALEAVIKFRESTYNLLRRDDMQTVTLTDRAIVRIVDLLQVAILTGTDITDNLRTLKLTLADGGKLTISDEDEKTFQAGIDRLHEQALILAAEMSRTDEIN